MSKDMTNLLSTIKLIRDKERITNNEYQKNWYFLVFVAALIETEIYIPRATDTLHVLVQVPGKEIIQLSWDGPDWIILRLLLWWKLYG